THQNLGESLPSRIASQSYVIGQIPSQIVRRHQECILKQPWILGCKVSKGSTAPYQNRTILHRFGAKGIIASFRQKRCAANDLPFWKPKEKSFLTFFGDKKISGAAARQKKQMLCRVSLVCDYSIGEESSFSRRRADDRQITLRESFKQSRLQ